MKCPKCGYLGFETVDRCRNCGYDFSLAADPSDAELPLREGPQAAAPLSDLELARGTEEARQTPRSALDLDRLIGAPDEEPDDPATRVPQTPSPALDPPLTRADMETAGDEEEEQQEGDEDERSASLPLFGPSRGEGRRNEPPLMTPPRPAGPPLSVRRATPDVARPRNRAARTTRRDEPPLSFPLDAPISTRTSTPETVTSAGATSPFEAASRAARVTAAAIDVLLLAGICLGVLYLTLRIADLTFEQLDVLPVVPMSAFLILLVAGYSIAFTAAGGQTIGKMATGIRVIGDDGRPVEISGAVLRAAGNTVNIATLGLAWLPALFSEDGRGIADRLAGTRVVRA